MPLVRVASGEVSAFFLGFVLAACRSSVNTEHCVRGARLARRLEVHQDPPT